MGVPYTEVQLTKFSMTHVSLNFSSYPTFMPDLFYGWHLDSDQESILKSGTPSQRTWGTEVPEWGPGAKPRWGSGEAESFL